MSGPDDLMQAKIVHLILNKKTEEALEMLSDFYHVDTPEIVVGTIKGKRRTVYAVYVQKERNCIRSVCSKKKNNPSIKILHLLQSLRGVTRILTTYKIKGWHAPGVRK